MKRYKRYIVLGILIALAVLAVSINNFKMGLMPHGPDEQAYIGAANRMVLFHNKSLTVFFPQADNLVAYILGVISKYVHVDTIYIFRYASYLLQIGIVYLFFMVGRGHSIRTGCILGLLGVGTVSTTYWLGPAYMVPSSLVMLAIPAIIFFLQKEKWVGILAVVLLMGLLYWWSLAPLITFIGCYLVLKQKRGWFILPVLLVGITVLLKTGFNKYVQQLISGTSYPAWYHDRLWEYTALLMLFPICISIIALFHKELFKNKWFQMGYALIATNALFFYSFGDQLQARTTYFLFFGFYLLIAQASVYYYKRLPQRVWIVLFMTLLVGQVLFVAENNKRDVFNNVQLTTEERSAFVWINDHIQKSSVIISDYGTMLLSNYYNDNQNYSLIEGSGVDYNKIAKILTQRIFTTEDEDYIGSLGQNNDIYIMLSKRTCLWLGYWKAHNTVQLSREMSPSYSSCPVPAYLGGIQKPLYENSEVKIYPFLDL